MLLLAAPAPSGTTTASAAISVPPPSMLRGKTIEEIVNRWSGELETHVREFNKFAGEVAVWDRALIENGNNLAALYAHVLAAEREQNDVDQSLDHIEQQQRDLTATLEAYERSAAEILGGQGGSLRTLDTGPADTERDKNYMLATELHGHLDDLSGSLTQMIDAVNALALPSASGSGAAADGEDAMGQISQILSSHLESLVWIDGAVREVESKITDVERRVRASGEGGLGAAKARGFAFARD
ncbi:Nsp1-like C-terminal region-domain-containing protein [Amylocystis lapponica]|nr:Nsp1-like C-terminal region-domain-containing protein [Amylocystis lapponica]